MSADPSLYEQLGGQMAVSAVVVKLYKKILSDDHLIPFFEHIDMNRLRASQTAFVTMAFGGPATYTGQRLRDAHKNLVAKGLNDTHFNLVVRHLKDSMKEMGVDQTLISHAIKIVETTRDDILNREKGEKA